MNSAFVDQIYYLALLLKTLAAIAQIGSSVIFDHGVSGRLCLCALLLLVLVDNGLEDLLGLLFALVEVIGVRTDYNDAEVDCEVPDVDVKDELLGDTRDANGCPCLSTILHAWVCIDVVHQNLDVLRLQLGDLLWVSENGDGVHGAHQHSASECLRQVLLDALLNYPPRLIRHPERLESLEEHTW